MEDGQRKTKSQVQFKRLSLCCVFLLTTTGLLYFEESTAVVGALSSWNWSTSGSQLPARCLKTLQSLHYAEAICLDSSNLTSSKFFNLTDDIRESLKLLRGKTIACVGDSRVRFFCMLIWSGLTNQSYQFSNRENHYQEDRVFVSKAYNITLMFYWIVHPYDARLGRLLSSWIKTNSTPQLAMFQFGAHSVASPRHGANESDVFGDSVMKIGIALKELHHHKGTLSIWMSTRISQRYY
ncbi:hypothetical protein RvY_04416 [Ramazzottius varieornatus]|uniref:SGNH domain-containing protein n=1 Tax=Ramazzottius varieornatus TaxID=947166 RepID=A0A1D1UUY0_RAMVA|nr:hypothetical protein RvY_04416 [Ramazzottius varieornatus]